jgi:sugar phosphate isomerase/epimerase
MFFMPSPISYTYIPYAWNMQTLHPRNGGVMREESANQPPWNIMEENLPFDLSLVAEETGSDFSRSLSVARSLGIRNLDFGSLWGQRIDHVPFGNMVRAKQLLREHNVSVRIIATEAFKPVVLGGVGTESIGKDPHCLEHLELVRASIDAARFFGAPMVRIFSFRRDTMIGLGNPTTRFARGGDFPEEMVEKVAAALTPALDIAREEGVVLAVENVRSCWCNSGRNTALLLQAVDSPWLKVIWDPANAFVSGEENVTGEGYAEVRSSVAHVHLKDAVVLDQDTGLTEWERIGDGSVELLDSLRVLRDDGYNGCVSIETHWRPEGSDQEENTRGAYSGLMGLLADICAEGRRG